MVQKGKGNLIKCKLTLFICLFLSFLNSFQFLHFCTPLRLLLLFLIVSYTFAQQTPTLTYHLCATANSYQGITITFPMQHIPHIYMLYRSKYTITYLCLVLQGHIIHQAQQQSVHCTNSSTESSASVAL